MSLIPFLFFALAWYELIDVFRAFKRRVAHPEHRHRAIWRTAAWLIGAQVLLVYIILLEDFFSRALIVSIAAGLELIVVAALAKSFQRQLSKTKPVLIEKNYSDRELPTLTVCIPARNESEELQVCLRDLVASSYPKLEILVLDDCSQNRHTASIIRDFAQSGVRFVAGQEPPERWLAKNYAYKQLADEANGELLLFCGVDTRFEPGSLTALVSNLLVKKKSMMSLLPQNVPVGRFGLGQLLVQPMRYGWEMVLPRRRFDRPPVLSTCWLIRRETLEAAGSFDAVRHQAIPERHLAQYAVSHEDGYSFIQADAAVGITSHKSFQEQRATAVRTRYPRLHRRPELVALVSLAELGLFIWPLGAGISAVLGNHLILAVLDFITYLLAIWLYSQVVSLTYRKFYPASLLTLPLAVAYDVALLNYSMLQYEFGEVLWKGRNICLPVMHAVPSSASSSRGQES